MSVTLSGREKRRAVIEAAGSILDMTPSFPRRRAIRTLSGKQALAHDARSAARDLTTASANELRRAR